MESPAELRRKARRYIDRANMIEQAGALALRLEEMVEGMTVVFTKIFKPGGPRYHYAAVKANGRWNTTGPKSPKDYTSTEFANWLRGRTVGSGRPVDDLQGVTRFYPIHEAFVTVHDGEGASSGGEADELARMQFDARHRHFNPARGVTTADQYRDRVWASASDSDSGGSRGPY